MSRTSLSTRRGSSGYRHLLLSPLGNWQEAPTQYMACPLSKECENRASQPLLAVSDTCLILPTATFLFFTVPSANRTRSV